jgi:hypothetical protein
MSARLASIDSTSSWDGKAESRSSQGDISLIGGVLKDRCLFAAEGKRGLLNLPMKWARDTEEDTDFRSEEVSQVARKLMSPFLFFHPYTIDA